MRGHARCVELLLAAGSDANLADADGRTAATIALHFGHDALAFRIEQGAPWPTRRPNRVGQGNRRLRGKRP